MPKLPIPLPSKEEMKIIRDSMFSPNETLFIPIARAAISVFVCDVIWIQSIGNYVKFHTYNGPVLSIFSMKELIERLPDKKFCRVSRSIIVNVAWVAWFDKDQVVLLNGQDFGFGEGGKKRLIEVINLL
jgi:DNA-binding LytR/AlgR family response regulator